MPSNPIQVRFQLSERAACLQEYGACATGTGRFHGAVTSYLNNAGERVFYAWAAGKTVQAPTLADAKRIVCETAGLVEVDHG